MSIVVAHLSDIHIKFEHDKVLKKASKIATKIKQFQHEAEVCFIVVSGDIAFSGKKAEYSLAKKLLSEIQSNLHSAFDKGVKFVIAPGNHDCDFSKSNKVREVLVDNLPPSATDEICESIVDQCSSIQSDFFDFRDEISNIPLTNNKKLWYRHDYTIGDKTISFDCLNFSWCSKLQEGQGDLVFPIDQFEEEFNKKSDLRFFIFHHPLNWIKQGQYQSLRSKIRANSDIILCGHEHTGAVSQIDDKEHGDSLIIEGACLQKNGSTDFSEFHILRIDPCCGSFKYKTFTYSNGDYNQRFSHENGSIFKETPRIVRNGLSIDNEFMKWLLDPGANFSHPYKQNIGLDDIFVYPDLEKFATSENERTSLPSSDLIQKLEANPKVLIRADENHGKTALLKTLYTSLFDDGFAPIYIDASTINKAGSSDLNKIFTSVIEEQYGKDSVTKFLSSPKEKIIILFDNLDKIRVADRYQHKVIAFYKKLSKKLIITSSESMEFSELISPEITNELAEFAHYKIRHFGNKLRYELIKKWRSIGNDYNLSAADLIAKVDGSEKILNSVIGKNLVPKAPIYVLTILQSLEASNPSNDFHNGGLGYYYQYLITEALGIVNVKALELDEVFNFLSQLAWFIYSQDSAELEENTFESFAEAYSKEFTKISPSDRLQRLVKSKLISQRGRFYSFSYPYIYFYFLGKYFADNISDDLEVENIISRCCDHIYIHENANIVMFVTHHTKNKKIISSIQKNLSEIFNERQPITFDGDTESLNGFIDETSKLVYKESNPDDVRKKTTELKDQIDEEENSQNGSDEQECENELDLVSKINKLIKTTEILGQMLKSYYGSIKNPAKKELIKEIFDASLRALRDFYQTIEDQGSCLTTEIEKFLESKAEIKDEQKRKAIAKRFCYQIIGSITTSLIIRPAAAVSSAELRTIISETVDDHPSTAFKLIRVASELELPGDLNFEQIRNLYQSVKGDMFCQRILQTLILKHLYFFKVSEDDKQRICSATEIPIEYQHKIDFRNKGSKIS